MIHKDGSECTVLNFKCIEMRNLREENEKLKLNYLKLSDAHTDSLEENEKLKVMVEVAKESLEKIWFEERDLIKILSIVEKALQKLEVK